MNFKSKCFVFILIVCILFGIAAVSAADNQTDDALNQDMVSNDEIEVSDNDLNDKLTQTTNKSYNDFYDDIKDCTDTFNIQSNYKYDNEKDKMIQLVVNKSNFVINGNNHVIDGSGKAQGFIFVSDKENITINNLTFINCNQAVMTNLGNLTLNNVNFTGNFLNGMDEINKGIVTILLTGKLTLNNCNFDSNINSTLIEAHYVDVGIYNSHFCNTQCASAAICVNRNELVIENSTFENLSSKYGGVTNFKGDYLSVKNSTFRNIHADLTGGSILAKFFIVPADIFAPQDQPFTPRPLKDWIFEECVFLNVSSGHDGGAIYMDLDSGSSGVAKTVHISNCNFTDSASGFGGAIADQGGFLNISNSNFINSRANNVGGAFYTAWANMTLAGCNLINNNAKSNAGAIYFDKGKLIIDKSNFTGNKVNAISSGKESVIYANDVDANVNNSIFNNGGVAIYANFANDNSHIDISNSTDLFLMDNKEYIVSVENKGIKLSLVNNEIVIDKLPSRFDARDWGWASPLKFQGDNMACWAFATAGSLECALLKQTGVLYNISEDNIQNLQLKYYSEGDLRNNGTGFAYSGLGYALSWYGVVMSQDDPYDERGMFSEYVQTENRIHVQDAMIIFGGRNDTMEMVKRAIIKYGAVSIQFHYEPLDYNRTNYTDEEILPSHFVTVIGWDDNYSRENFNGSIAIENNVLPKGDGAWLIKDSESRNLSENECTYIKQGGYLRISYYNPSFLSKDLYAVIPQNAAIAYIFENTIDYHVNYQTDLTGLAGFDENFTYYSNEFTSKYSELIGAVGTYFNDSGIGYSFDIYVNGFKVHSQSGVSEFAGFRTIVLNKYIPVSAGDKFKVVFKNNNVPFQAFSRQHYIQGMSFVSKDGKSWSDITLQNRTVCLKVYTVKDDTKIIDNKDITVDYDGGSYFSVKVITVDGRAVGAGAVVKFTINGKTYTVKTDDNGIAKVKITDVPNKYAITTSYNGKSYKNTVTVKQVLTASKVTIKKKTAKKLVLKAKLKINGKLVKGKKITFKFKGKKYTVKTNKNGIAKKTLKKKVIKKLKKGKKYAVKVTYLKTTIKTTVKVK